VGRRIGLVLLVALALEMVTAFRERQMLVARVYAALAERSASRATTRRTTAT
jgi:hypothetical protein